MSEEEIMDNIKDFLQLEEIHSNNNAIKSFLSIYQEALQGLLDLYNKEKEKNKKLIDGQIETLEKILAPKLLEKFISKDKIKEKIEEYEEIIESSIIKDDYKREVEHIIRVLKEVKGDN